MKLSLPRGDLQVTIGDVQLEPALDATRLATALHAALTHTNASRR
jgi:hypothetical protein